MPMELTSLAGRGRGEALDEDEGGDDGHREEDQHRDGVVGPAGEDEDVVEDPEGVQGAEQQRDQDRRLQAPATGRPAAAGP
jgi:hypothetical protein